MDIDCQIDLETLWRVCQKFVNDQEIICSECIYQSDNVIENAYEFIETICEIVGYKDLGPDQA